MPDIGELCGIVDEKVAGYVIVGKAEVFPHNLQRLIHALSDGNARHNHNEFCEAVPPVKLVDCFGVDIGFPRSGFHLNAEAAIFQALRRGEAVALSDGLHIGKQCVVVGEQGVAHAVVVLDERKLIALCDGEGAAVFFLAQE